MNITLFGATGRTGKYVLRQAINRGCSITATKLPAETEPEAGKNNAVTFIDCDVTKTDDVQDAIDESTDAVVSVIGHGPDTLPRMQTTGITNMLEAMRGTNTNRIVSLTGVGASHPKDPSHGSGEILTKLLEWVAPDRIADGREHAEKMYESDVDWTLVRAQKLTMGERTEDYTTGYIKAGLLATVSRANVAHFMLNCLEKKQWIQEAPIIIDA